MTAAELQEKIVPKTLDLGIVEDGKDVSFLLLNNSGIPIEGFRKPCDCLGNITRYDDRLEGTLKAKYKEPSKIFYEADGQFVQMYQTNQGPKYFNPKTNRFVENPQTLSEPINLHEFNQTITLEFADGERGELVDTNGEIKPNTKKLKISVPVRMLVKK